MQDNPELSIIIVSYNVRQLLLNCIQSIIESTAGIDYEIIVVDNASNDGSATAVKERFPELQVIANKGNAGFAFANNQGYAVSKGDFLLLLNPDTVVKPDAIRSVLEFIKNTPDTGMAGCRLLNPDGTLQKSIRRFPSVLEHIARAFFVDRFIFSEYRRNIYYRTQPFEIDYCTGAFMMIHREALGDMPLLDPEFFMYAEEKDLALRLREKGWKTNFVPSGEIIHLGEQSTKQMAVEMFLELQKSQIKFFSQHFYGLHKNLLIWSYYLSLCTYCIGSLLLPFSSYGRFRLKLFIAAVRSYPVFVSKLKGSVQVVTDKYVHEQQFWNDWVKISEDYIRQRFNYIVDDNFVPLGHPWPDSFKYMFGIVGDVAGKDVLDCGAGTGWGSIILARKKAKKVIAIDVSDGMLALLKKLARINGVESIIQTQRAAIEDAVFEQQSFDLIFCSNVLHHADLQEVMSRIYKWLKPGGIAVCSEPLANSRFLTRVRSLVPVKKIGTDTERGLNLKEIKDQAARFSEFTFKEFQLFSRLDRVIGNQRIRKALLSFDSWVLEHFPALRYFARIIVFRMRK